jgi:hypothetical protein
VIGLLASAAVVLLALLSSQHTPRPAAVEPQTANVPAPAHVPAVGEDDEQDAEVRAALDEAEREYAAAAAALERRYRKQRASLSADEAQRADALLSRGRPRWQNASAGDVEMRQVMLATHADYVHALHTFVGGMEDVR